MVIQGSSGKGFQTAANYCLNNNINTKEALGWAQTAVQRNPSYQTHATHAGLLYQDGNEAASNAEALDKALKLANPNQVNAAGYALLGQKTFSKGNRSFQNEYAEKNPNECECVQQSW